MDNQRWEVNVIRVQFVHAYQSHGYVALSREKGTPVQAP